MDEQELIDNLQGQEYVNGYVVNSQIPNFVELKKSIRLNTEITKMKDIRQNEIFVKRPKEKSPIVKYRQINVISADMAHYEEHREFERAKRVDLQIQNRINERLVNQIATSYAPQPSTLAELKALQSTRPQLQQELEAVEEYVKTHYLTEAQKAKLKEEVYKKNYDEWKISIQNVKEGTANTEAPEKEQQQFPRDPVIPSGPNLNIKELIDSDIRKHGDLIDLVSNIGETQIRRMADELIQPEGEFMTTIKKRQRREYQIYSNFLVLLFSNKDIFINRIITQLNKPTIPKYLTGIFRIINGAYNSIYRTPLIKTENIKLLKNLSNISLQYEKFIDTLFKIFQEVKFRIPREVDNELYIIVSDTNFKKDFGGSPINILMGDLYITTYRRFNDFITSYSIAYATKQGQPVNEIEIDAGNDGGGEAMP